MGPAPHGPVRSPLGILSSLPQVIRCATGGRGDAATTITVGGEIGAWKCGSVRLCRCSPGSSGQTGFQQTNRPVHRHGHQPALKECPAGCQPHWRIARVKGRPRRVAGRGAPPGQRSERQNGPRGARVDALATTRAPICVNRCGLIHQSDCASRADLHAGSTAAAEFTIHFQHARSPSVVPSLLVQAV